MGRTLQNRAFPKTKRKFLISVFGLLGFFPFVQFFRHLNRKPYFLLAHLHGKYTPKKINEPYMKRDLFKKLNNKMFQQGKLIKYHYIPTSNKTSWLYVFNSYESYKEWMDEAYRSQLFSAKKLPGHLKYSETEGFLNSTDLALV